MSEVGKKVELAVYRNMEPGTLSGFETISRSELYEGYSTYVRISEKVEVTFEPLKSDAVIQDALRALDAAELKAREDLQVRLDHIKNQRAELLALTYKPAEVAARPTAVTATARKRAAIANRSPATNSVYEN